jgi:hypothetical protein
MLGTLKGRWVCQLRGSPFFAYFLWRSKESELSPGNPRLGREIITKETTLGANRYAQCARFPPYPLQLKCTSPKHSPPTIATHQTLICHDPVPPFGFLKTSLIRSPDAGFENQGN